MPALSQSLEFVNFTTSSVSVVYPNTATGVVVFTSAKAKGDGYYGNSDGFHTVTYTTNLNFVGTVTMQATLATDPVESDWFDVQDTAVTYTEFDERTDSTVNYYNFTGNFVWVRGHLRIKDGILEAIQYNH